MGIPVPENLKPRGSGASAPPRRAGSVRRTSTMDFTWSDGLGSDTILDARARDLLTARDGSVENLAEARLGMVSDPQRLIREITSVPGLPELAALIGGSAMSGLRRRLAATVADEIAAATPLHLLLDDVPGATLVSGAAFQCWYDLAEYLTVKATIARQVMTDVCTGYQQGSSALQQDGTLRWSANRTPAEEIEAVGDPIAWHAHPSPAGVSMRRARRIDVWVTGQVIHVDAFYQDSSTLPEGGRRAIHEYTLTAEADLESQTLRAVTPVPRALPYDECPLAVLNTSNLVGLPLADLRPSVLRQLRGPLGCTHLNDMLRSLADVPGLVTHALGGATA